MKKLLLPLALIMLIMISSCQKSEELTDSSSLKNETIKKLGEAGLKPMNLSSFPKNAKIITIETEDELNFFLDTLKKVKLSPLTVKSTLIDPKKSTTSNNLMSMSQKLLSTQLLLSEDGGGSTPSTGSSFGPGLSNGSSTVRVNLRADYTYPWCDLDVEVAMTKNSNNKVNGHLVTVSATGGIGGFNMNSSTNSSAQNSSVTFSFSGVLYCGINYNGNYYGNSGTITVNGWAHLDGQGGANFSPTN